MTAPMAFVLLRGLGSRCASVCRWPCPVGTAHAAGHRGPAPSLHGNARDFGHASRRPPRVPCARCAICAPTSKRRLRRVTPAGCYLGVRKRGGCRVGAGQVVLGTGLALSTDEKRVLQDLLFSKHDSSLSEHSPWDSSAFSSEPVTRPARSVTSGSLASPARTSSVRSTAMEPASAATAADGASWIAGPAMAGAVSSVVAAPATA
jgi:hypothetical protein